jgi:hypothetical protein
MDLDEQCDSTGLHGKRRLPGSGGSRLNIVMPILVPQESFPKAATLKNDAPKWLRQLVIKSAGR